MTVEKWLGKDNTLGIDIWKNKYQYENETFDEWLDRVSNKDSNLKQLILDKKFLFGGRILSNRGLQNKGKKVTYSNCFSGDTEIMTLDGLKKLEDLIDTDISVLSYGKWRPATVKSFGIQKVVNLTLNKCKSKKEVQVTKDHIWYVLQDNGIYAEVKTEDLKEGMKLAGSCLKCYTLYKPSPFGVAHGAFFGDGDHNGKCRRMNFCGDKEELMQYFTPDTIGENGDVKTIYGIPKVFWGSPDLNETPSYLYGWLAGYFATDGSIDERGSCVICSANEENLKIVQDVLCVLGIPCENIRKQNRLSNLTNTYSDVYILTLNKNYLNESFFLLSKHRERFLNNPPKKNDCWKVESIVDNGVSIPVFCVVENEKHSFTLKNGILTHNCYVISSPEDNIESIFECAGKLARTFSYGGGCGIDISKLSPKGAKVNNAAKETTGSVSFMDLYSMITGLIGQAGRRGALMISLDCNHPDIEDFIEIKSDLNKVTKANISIKVTNDFMNAVKDDKEYTLKFTRIETGEEIVKTVNAKKLFEKLCKMNWDMAEPGLLYWDNINKYNLLSNTEGFEYASVNPCAEEPLPAGGSCLLGSINLNAFVNKENKTFNFEDFKNTVKISIRALNDVLDEGLSLHPLQEQRDSVRDWRQIGCGVMGIADMLINLGITYGSEESIKLCDKIAFEMANTAIKTSAKLAKEYGAFPKCSIKDVITTDYFINNTDKKTRDLVMEYGLRNSQLLTIAPTGSISTMLQISGGIEPIFANYYTRKTESLHNETTYYKVYTPIVKNYMEEHNISNDNNLPKFFITSKDLDYKSRINMQSVWQKHIDASISSTVNLPVETTVDDVYEIYLYAWEKNLKGITVYRDGCKRSGILITEDTKTDDKEELMVKYDSISPVSRKTIGTTYGNTYCKKTACGTSYITINKDIDGNIVECFVNTSKGGICKSNIDGLNRMISLSLRSGVRIDEIIDQLSGITCQACVKMKTKGETLDGLSCPDTISRTLREFVLDDNNPTPESKLSKNVQASKEILSPRCPECGSKLRFEGGCSICVGDEEHIGCGWSKCS